MTTRIKPMKLTDRCPKHPNSHAKYRPGRCMPWYCYECYHELRVWRMKRGIISHSKDN